MLCIVPFRVFFTPLQQLVTHSCTPDTHFNSHTPSFPPPAVLYPQRCGFQSLKGGRTLAAADGGELFCHRRLTVILRLITPALRLNWVTSIPAQWSLWRGSADTYHGAVLPPERMLWTLSLQTSGDNVSQKRERKKYPDLVRLSRQVFSNCAPLDEHIFQYR